jgi:hypothetical protein
MGGDALTCSIELQVSLQTLCPEKLRDKKKKPKSQVCPSFEFTVFMGKERKNGRWYLLHNQRIFFLQLKIYGFFFPKITQI